VTTDLQYSVAAALSARADRLPVHPDPYARFIRVERRRRARRRLRAAGVVAVAGCTVIGIGTGIVSLPGWMPAIRTDGNWTAGSALLQEPTRGSLAHDAEWQEQMRAAVQDIEETEGRWRVVDRGGIRFVFAGDVPALDRRLALVVVPLRLGVREAYAPMWYEGPLGAAVQDMRQGATYGDKLPEIVTFGELGLDAGAALVIAPADATLQISRSASYTAQGRVSRNWEPLPTAGGVAVARFRGVPSGMTAMLRMQTERGETTLAAGALWQASIGPDLPVGVTVAATKQTRGVLPADDVVDTAIEEVLRDCAVDPTTATIRIPWAGTVAAGPALLITVQPLGGGTLVYGTYLDGRTIGLRLLVPAAGAETRPFAFWIKGDHPTPEMTTLLVIAPANAARAELVIGHDVRPVDLDTTGAAVASLPLDTPASIRAYDADGKLLGQTPVQPSKAAHSPGLPGESTATRVVP
jgi:hypothetical protein